jgi:LacI family transcriptional regulator
MNDVARVAGVGTMTVSRVLNGTACVSEETARRVQAAIGKLQYRPNEMARVFRGQRSRTIGLIIPYLYDPFFANCAHAVTTVAKEHGYSVITTTSDESPDTEYMQAEQMLQRSVEGLLLIPTRLRQSHLTRALFGRTPVVVFDRPLSDTSFDVVLVHRAWAPTNLFHGTQPEPVYHQRAISWLSPRHARSRLCGGFVLRV